MSPMPQPPPMKDDPLRIEISRDAEELARHAATIVVGLAGRSLGSRGRFTLALAGGSTPRRLYETLAQPHHAHQIVWPAVQVFFGDERCVPLDHPASNGRMARETLLSKVPIPPDNVHPMRVDEPDPDRAARESEADLRSCFQGAMPRLDLVLLGMGEDGHTASLFPGGPELEETGRLVTHALSPDGVPRLTLTLPAINAARVVAVLVSGEAKASMVHRVLGAEATNEGLPIQRVRPTDGQLLWLLDEAAASELRT
jgi:6-phosphogluconolactonase